MNECLRPVYGVVVSILKHMFGGRLGIVTVAALLCTITTRESEAQLIATVHVAVVVGDTPGCTPGDVDGDGMDDCWEIANFGNTTDANETTDHDDDGALDLHEYLAKTDPQDSDSQFKMHDLVLSATGLEITWLSTNETSTATTFDVVCASNLNDFVTGIGLTTVNVSVVSSGEFTTASHPIDPGEGRFYGVQVNQF